MADARCQACKREFTKRRTSHAYCSRKCAWSQNGGHNKKAETWWTDAKGYIQGRVWDGDKQRRVKQHRLVVERHIGRRLLPGEDVHHKDGDKKNNAVGNLELIAHGAHTRITNKGRTYKRGYTLNLTDAERAARSERMRNFRAAIAKATVSP